MMGYTNKQEETKMKLTHKELDLLKDLVEVEIDRNQEEPIGGWQRKLRLKSLDNKIRDAWAASHPLTKE